MEKYIKEFDRRIAELKRQIAALEQLKESFKASLKDRTPVIGMLLDAIESMGIDRDVLLSCSRKRGRILFARCVLAARLRKYGYTLQEIANLMRRNHCTVLYYIKSYNKAMKEPRFEKDFYSFITEFNTLLNE